MKKKLARLINRRNPVDKFTQIDQAAHSGAFGNNPLPLPTDKQIAAGTYKKGKVALYGLTIAIEQPQNSYRTGIDQNGKRWACRMAANYGYILGTKGNDGDHVDCFIGSYPQSDRVFIINQYVNGVFDEHKVMLAYPAVEFARSDYNFSYAQGWDGLHSIVETSVKNFKWWLKNGDMTKPLTAEQLPPESENDMKVFWDSANNPIGTNTAQLLYDLCKIDADDGLLLDAVSVGDFIHDADAGSVDFDVLLDSLHTPYSSLARVCSKIGFAMKNQAATDSQGNALTLVEPTADEPNPSGLDTTFKRNGVVNLAAIYQLTDGQSFTIVFHNPDSTPGKLAKTDTLIAWKFLLNKRDITIAVAPEKGDDLKLPEVAKRVMMLAEKNSAAFARANKGVAERVALISGLKTEITELEQQKAQAQADYEMAKAAYDEREIAKATEPKAPFVATHTVDDDGAQVPVKMNDDGVWQAENGTEYDGYEAEPIVNNPVQPIGKSDNGSSTENPNNLTGIDPATLANLNAASISEAMRKKAIAYLEANPASHKLFEKETPAGKKAYAAVMESVKTALFNEVKSLHSDFIISNNYVQLTLRNPNADIGGRLVEITVKVDSANDYKMTFGVNDYSRSTANTEIADYKNLFDSTTTLEDLRAWGFALPFDLDVKSFVVNVIKPVVDEFLSKQTMQNQEPNELQKNLPKNTIAGDSNDIANLAEKIMANEVPANEKRAVRYSVVSDVEAEKIKQATNLDVKGYKHTVDSFGIRHAISQHGDEKTESARGQEAIKIADIAKIPEIVANPDSIEPAGKDANGNDLIRYSKRFNGSIYFVEEVREGRMELVAKTMWKTRTDVTMPDESSQKLTPEATGGNLPHDEQSINPLAQNATASFDAEIESLRGLIGNDQFQTVLDNLLDKLEAAGVDSQYEQVVGDIMNQHAEAIIAAAKGA